MKKAFWIRFRERFGLGPRQRDSQSRSSRRNFLGTGFLAALGSGMLLGNRGVSADSHDTKPKQKLGSAHDSRGYGLSISDGIESAWSKAKSKASPEDLYRLLYALPKGGDIHHHHGGGMLPEMIWDICTNPSRNGGQAFYARFRISSFLLAQVGDHSDSRSLSGWVTIANHTYEKMGASLKADFKLLKDLNEQEKQAWMNAMFLDNAGEGRDEFFEYIWNRLDDVLQSIDVMMELTVENMRRFGAEGVRYMEIQSRFRGWKDSNGTYLSRADAMQKWKDRFAKPDAKETGVLIKFQTIVLRFADDAEERVMEYFEYTHNNKDLWLGINMAGREDDNRGYPTRFTAVYDEMLRKFPDVGISIHAGEAEKKDTHIFDTLRLGATRIGHGINLIRDPQTMQMMRGKNYLIEINLISNHLLGYTPDLNQHPFPIFMRQGIPCCLNTDDRGMWSSNMTDEYYVAVSRFNLSWKELVQLGENSLKHCFLDEDTKAHLLSDYYSDLAAFQSRLENEGWQSVASGTKAVTYDYGKGHLNLNFS